MPPRHCYAAATPITLIFAISIYAAYATCAFRRHDAAGCLMIPLFAIFAAAAESFIIYATPIEMPLMMLSLMVAAADVTTFSPAPCSAAIATLMPDAVAAALLMLSAIAAFRCCRH